VSPKGLGSGIRMIQYFINRGGKNLSAARRRELERAKRILQRKAAARRKQGVAKGRPVSAAKRRRARAARAR
jgi:hypothetical protein